MKDASWRRGITPRDFKRAAGVPRQGDGHADDSASCYSASSAASVVSPRADVPGPGAYDAGDS